MEKWSTAGAGNPILALWQIGGRKLTYLTGFSTALGSEITGGWYRDKPIYVPPLDNFVALGAGSRNWSSCCSNLNGDIYAVVDNGDIYKKDFNSENFIALNVGTNLQWKEIISTPSNDIYAIAVSSGVWKQSNSTGDFVHLGGLGGNFCVAMCCTPSGDIYICNQMGAIWVQYGGTGNFTAEPLVDKYWFDICCTPSGIVYACSPYEGIWKKGIGDTTFSRFRFVSGEYPNFLISNRLNEIYFVGSSGIYKQNISDDSFDLISEISANRMFCSTNNNIYFGTSNEIYKQYNSLGDFTIQNAPDNSYQNFCEDINNNIYSCTSGDDLYRALL